MLSTELETRKLPLMPFAGLSPEPADDAGQDDEEDVEDLEDEDDEDGE